jgi:hypothetical protein
MARTALVTVPDEGAAWMVRDALKEGGISAEIERAGADHPYTTTALARPMRIWVPADQAPRARELLAALEADMANHEEELASEALAAGGVDPESAPPPSDRSAPRLSWALALGLLLPIPVVCLYARAHRLGALFLGVFVVAVLYAPPWELRLFGFSEPDEDAAMGLLAPALKVVDVAVGLPLVMVRRRRAARAILN